jgi:hypothetical protein
MSDSLEDDIYEEMVTVRDFEASEHSRPKWQAQVVDGGQTVALEAFPVSGTGKRYYIPTEVILEVAERVE